jgi:hypothetical protein
LSLNENEKSQGEDIIEQDTEKELDLNESKKISLPALCKTEMITPLGVLKATDEWFAHLLDEGIFCYFLGAY